MQCLWTRLSNKNNYTSIVQSPNNGGHPEERKLTQFPDSASHSLGMFSLEATTFTGELLYLM